MRITFYTLIALVAATLPRSNAAAGDLARSSPEAAAAASVPPALRQRLEASGLAREYSLVLSRVNPFYLTGDFDGDGKEDFACWLHRKAATKASGRVLVVLFGSGAVSYPERDSKKGFPAGDAWYVVHPGTAISSAPEHNKAAPPILKCDAMMMMKLESSAAVVYWNGHHFDVYWTAD